jgi:hypothetical protein
MVDEQEIGVAEAARMLGIAMVLADHRMNIGDLPFREIDGRRRAKRKDVMALRAKLDAQRAALFALAADADDLARRYGV